MMLTVRTIKRKKESNEAERKEYRFAGFDTYLDFKDLPFELKFNRALGMLKDQINADRENNDVTVYEPIQVVDVFLS